MKPKDENETHQFAPWELETKKSTDAKKRSIPPNNEKSRLFSRPKSKDHCHLEMYILAREKERLEKYGSTLGRRVKTISSTWKDVKFRMHDLHKTTSSVGTEGIEEMITRDKDRKEIKKKKDSGGVKKVDWDY